MSCSVEPAIASSSRVGHATGLAGGHGCISSWERRDGVRARRTGASGRWRGACRRGRTWGGVPDWSFRSSWAWTPWAYGGRRSRPSSTVSEDRRNSLVAGDREAVGGQSHDSDPGGYPTPVAIRRDRRGRGRVRVRPDPAMCRGGDVGALGRARWECPVRGAWQPPPGPVRPGIFPVM